MGWAGSDYEWKYTLTAVFPTNISCQTLKKTQHLGFHTVFEWSFTSHTLARPSILVEGETRVARTGIRSRNIRTQLLAVAVATFINVWKQNCKQGKICFLLNHRCHPSIITACLFWISITKGSTAELTQQQHLRSVRDGDTLWIPGSISLPSSLTHLSAMNT